MRKLICLFIFVFISGCAIFDIGNTPTKKVEEYLNKFQILDEEVLDQLDSVLNRNIGMNDEIKDEYRELIKKQYKDMQYTIKDERQDGDDAVVTAEVNVKYFTKVIREVELYKREHISEFYQDDVYNDNLYKKYLLDRLKNCNVSVTYTLEFNVHNYDGKWRLLPISDEIEDKILGIYNY